MAKNEKDKVTSQAKKEKSLRQNIEKIDYSSSPSGMTTDIAFVLLFLR